MVLVGSAMAAAPGEILRDLQHLAVAGSVLYVAAHPDDENTSLLTWLEGQGIEATYLSMTRGGGGQNLIGSEQAQLLGVLRTGELLAARRVDGAEQRFTRMVDFGYSKSSEETLRLWGHDDALDDVVRAIREVRPDVIVTRFPTEGETHGHHLASAILAHEAFVKAGDPAYVTDGLEAWQADRLLHNVSSWGITPETDTSAWARLDVGGYDARIGRSTGELAAESRSMHKSQGFGTAPEVGPDVEWFASKLGTPVAPGESPLDGLDITIGRFEGTKALQKAIDRAVKAFDPAAPHEVIPLLAKVRDELDRLPFDARRQRDAVDELLADCAGLWLTARAERPAVAPGGRIAVTTTVVARAPVDVVVRDVWVAERPPMIVGVLFGGPPIPPLDPNVPSTHEHEVEVPDDLAVTRPHWLAEPGTSAQDTISEPTRRTLADRGAPLRAWFRLTIDGVYVSLDRPVEFAETDPVEGERVQLLEVLPPVTATFDHPSLVLAPSGPATTRITLRADTGPASGVLRLTAPPGITAEPSEIPYDLTDAAPERIVEVRLTAAPGTVPGPLVVESAFQRAVIDHPHLARRTVLTPAVQQLVPLDVARGGTELVGYVTGPGDAVADGLRAMGYRVEELTDEQLAGDLSRFDAIVTGIRAYNTRPRLLALHERLMAYVAGGGRLVVQYNTNNRFDPLSGPIGPHPFEIGRGRVTDETAAVTGELPGPNAVVPADLDGWVQERGLYFASTWDPAYEAPLAMADPGEEPQRGALLIAHHGEGVFVYTGLSFFRQLPAGVPGAYRLLANLLALE